MINSIKVSMWFTIVTVLAIIWNAMGVMAYIMDVMLTGEDIAKMSEVEQNLRFATPSWAKSAFAIAVFGGLLGSVLLLVKKALAFPVLIMSFIAIIVQMYNAFFIMDSFAVFGPGGTIMPIMVIVFGALLIWLAMHAKTQQWIK